MNNAELKTYILTSLGHPVINIEIADEQLDIVIQDTMDLFREYHVDALKLKCIDLELFIDQTEYDMPADTFAVVEIYNRNGSMLGSIDANDPLLMKPLYVGNAGLFDATYNVSDIEVLRNKINMSNVSMARDVIFDYSCLEQKLKILTDTRYFSKNTIVVVQSMVPEEVSYSSRWLKKMCVAEAGIIWAGNIGKYQGVTLPGGGQYSSNEIYEKYSTMAETMKEELLENYSTSYGIMVG